MPSMPKKVLQTTGLRAPLKPISKQAPPPKITMAKKHG